MRLEVASSPENVTAEERGHGITYDTKQQLTLALTFYTERRRRSRSEKSFNACRDRQYCLVQDLSSALGDLAYCRHIYHDCHDVFRIAFWTDVSLSVFTLEES